MRQQLPRNGKNTVMPFYRFCTIARAKREKQLKNDTQGFMPGSKLTIDSGSKAIFPNLAVDIGKGSGRLLRTGIYSIKRQPRRYGKRHVRNLKNLIGRSGSHGVVYLLQPVHRPPFQAYEEICTRQP